MRLEAPKIDLQNNSHRLPEGNGDSLKLTSSFGWFLISTLDICTGEDIIKMKKNLMQLIMKKSTWLNFLTMTFEIQKNNAEIATIPIPSKGFNFFKHDLLSSITLVDAITSSPFIAMFCFSIISWQLPIWHLLSTCILRLKSLKFFKRQLK